MSQTNIGTANYATQFGVPASTVTWTGRSGTSRAGTLFNSAEISAGGESSMTRDNSGEIQAIRTINDTIQYRWVVKPVGANAAAALAICGDLPKKGSLITVTSDAADTDVSVAGSIIVDDASKSYTPDGEAVINLTVTKHVGKTFSALS
jgi:hypothetical protein